MLASPIHHYLPRFYLEGFCYDGLLWVFDRKKSEIRKQSPKNTAAQKGYYTVEMKDGSKSEEVERILALAEGQAKPIIDKVRGKQKISLADKPILSAFVALMYLRVPTFERTISEFHERGMRKTMKMIFATEEQIETAIKEFEEKRGKKAPFSAKQWKDMVANDEVVIKATRIPSIHAMGTMVKPMTEWLLKMDWVFAYAPNDTSFAISDNPFVLIPPPGYYDTSSPRPIGVLTPETQKILPLAQDVRLVILDAGDKVQYVHVDKKQVQELNLASAFNSDRFVIARHQALVRSLVKKARLTSPGNQEKIQI